MLTGCGPRVGAQQPNPSEEFMVSLPALVIDLQPDGEFLIGSASLTTLAAAAGQDLALEPVDPAVIEVLQRANIQHVQIDNAPAGPLLLINGEPLPSIRWDEESLLALGLLLELFADDAEGLGPLLPLVRTLGVGLTLHLPLAQGAEPIPLSVTGEGSSAAVASASQEEWLALLDGEPLGLKLTLDFAADGQASLGGINVGFLSDLGVPLAGLNQTPAFMQSVSELGIEQISLRSDREGIALSINGQDLPSIAWTEGEMAHLLKIVLQISLQGSLEELDPRVQRVFAFVERWLAAAQTTELQLTANFN